MTDFAEKLTRFENARRGLDAAAHDPNVHAPEFYKVRDMSSLAWREVRSELRGMPESAEFGAQSKLLATLRRSGPGSGGK